MKCIILSDSHGDYESVISVLRQNRDAEVVIFLGDGLSDIYEVKKDFPSVAFIAVSGNCDVRLFDAPRIENITLEGKRIVLTHGDAFMVKSSLVGLRALAEDTRADIILFGHTHTATLDVIGTSYGKAILFNPGSVKGTYPSGKSYGILNLRTGCEAIPEIKILK